MNITALKTELTVDPLARGYSGMTDEQAATDLNTVYRTRNKTSMTGSEVINRVVPAEWNALTDAQQAKAWNIIHLGTLNPFGVEATMLSAIFGAGSATIAALAAARKGNVSRADELGFGFVYAGNVMEARL